ncbi:MAG: hypothetical protein VYC39_17035 [Myxococcota bacterium]|nr:hypothetical protein [Myxococcota bacterium]
MVTRVRIATILASLACWLLAAPTVNAEKIAVPNFKGKSKKVKAKVARAIRAELRASDYTVLGPKSLKKAAQGAGAGVRSLETAREGGAVVLVLGKVTGKKKKKIAVRVLDVVNGKEITSLEGRLKSSKRAKKVGKSMGKKISTAIAEHLKSLSEPPVSKSRAIAVAEPSSASTAQNAGTDDEFPEDTSAEVRSEPSTKATSVIPKDEIDTASSLSESPRSLILSEEEKEERVFEPVKEKTDSSSSRIGLQVDLEGGLLARHQYTVSVGTYATGLSNGLVGVPTMGGRLSYTTPFAGLGINVYGYFEPFAYNVAAVEPALEPVKPMGDFVNFGGGIHLDLGLYEHITFRTMLGAEQASMTVQEQFTADTMQPGSVVLSWTSLRPFLGIMGTISLLQGHLDLSFNTTYKLVSSYTEQPFFTGEFASGYDVVAGAGVRYWFNSNFGLFTRAEYEYKHVAFEGEGNRLLFDSDKMALSADRLLDAVADHNWLRIYLGLSMSF